MLKHKRNSETNIDHTWHPKPRGIVIVPIVTSSNSQPQERGINIDPILFIVGVISIIGFLSALYSSC